jgi:hypothetical protein
MVKTYDVYGDSAYIPDHLSDKGFTLEMRHGHKIHRPNEEELCLELLGMQYQRYVAEGTFELSQQETIREMLEINGMADCTLALTLAADKQRLNKSTLLQLDEQRKAIEELTKPYTDAMKALSDQTEELLKGRTESDAVLKQHIADLAKQAEQMTRVFSRPKDRGNWGELQLENVAESVGLRLGVDYVRQQQVRCLGQLNSKAGVQNVGGCHALMHEAGLVADLFCNPCQERDNVMLCDGFDCVDSRDVDNWVCCPPRPKSWSASSCAATQFAQ